MSFAGLLGIQFTRARLPIIDHHGIRNLCSLPDHSHLHFQQNMSKLLIKLRHAPDDEILEIRSLLQEHRIDFYETQAGPWGISAPGIWLKDELQYDRAKALMDEYQENRFREKHAEYEELRRVGKHRTFLQNLLEKPLQVILYSLIVGLILYFSISPFFPED